MSRQNLALALIVTASAVLVAVLSSPPQDKGSGPGGTVALRRYLEAMDLEVEEAGEPPEPGEGTFFLLADFRDEDGAERVLDWVRDGGRVVLASPASEIASELDIEWAEPGFDSVVPGVREARPGCEAFAGTGVAEVSIDRSDSPLRLPRGAQGCLKDEDGAYLAFARHGRGQVVVLAGRSPLTNQFLDTRDNALLAYPLFAGFGTVVYGPPYDPFTVPSGGLWVSLPGGARSALAALALALVVFAVVRGRRFGRPVIEQPISPIPSSQLVGAAAGLYQAAHATDFAARLLRSGAARRVARELGMPSNADLESVRSVAGATLGYPDLADALEETNPATDEQLIELARRLRRLEETVEGL